MVGTHLGFLWHSGQIKRLTPEKTQVCYAIIQSTNDSNPLDIISGLSQYGHILLDGVSIYLEIIQQQNPYDKADRHKKP